MSVSYVIECRRSGDGYMGRATAPAKDKDGDVMVFDDREEAEKQAREWQENTTGADVTYRVRERE